MKKHFFHKRTFFILLALVCGLQSRAQTEGDVFTQYHKTYFSKARGLDFQYFGERMAVNAKFRNAVRALGTLYKEEGNEEGWRATRDVLRKFEQGHGGRGGAITVEFMKLKDPFDIAKDPGKEHIELDDMIEKRVKMLQTVDEEEPKARDELRKQHIAYLEGVKNELTAQLKIEEARVVQNEIEWFKNAPTEEQTIDKMKRIIIPEVNFRDVKIKDAITFLQDASREYDGSTQGRRGIHFVLLLPDALAVFDNEPVENNWPTITFTTRYSKLHDIFVTIMELTRLDYRIHDGFVTIAYEGHWDWPFPGEENDPWKKR